MSLNVLICGAGRTGHLNAVLFKQMEGVRVALLTGNTTLADAHRAGGGAITALLPDGSSLPIRQEASIRCDNDGPPLAERSHLQTEVLDARFASHDLLERGRRIGVPTRQRGNEQGVDAVAELELVLQP